MLSSPDDLIQDLRSTVAEPVREVPATIWMFWNTGEETAPDIVRKSISTWRSFNPDHQVRVLDEAILASEFDIDYGAVASHYTVKLGEAGKSNILRMYLLLKFGGIWADATSFCMNPLSGWLHPQLPDGDLFMFRLSETTADRQIANWFIAASPNDPILMDVMKNSVAYLTRRRLQPLQLVVLNKINPPEDLIGRTSTGGPLLDFAEAKGLAPYFLNHYFFNEAIARHPDQWGKVLPLTNRFVSPRAKYRDYLVSDVAKLNRRPIYLKKQICHNRVAALFDGDTPDLTRIHAERTRLGLSRD